MSLTGNGRNARILCFTALVLLVGFGTSLAVLAAKSTGEFIVTTSLTFLFLLSVALSMLEDH